MKEELKKDIRKNYDSLKVMLAAQWLADEKNDNNYDIPLLTILVKDAGEEDTSAEQIFQVRIRKEEDRQEEFLVFGHSDGYASSTENLDEKIDNLATMIETITEGLLLKFPDSVLLYKWN